MHTTLDLAWVRAVAEHVPWTRDSTAIPSCCLAIFAKDRAWPPYRDGKKRKSCWSLRGHSTQLFCSPTSPHLGSLAMRLNERDDVALPQSKPARFAPILMQNGIWWRDASWIRRELVDVVINRAVCKSDRPIGKVGVLRLVEMEAILSSHRTKKYFVSPTNPCSFDRDCAFLALTFSSTGQNLAQLCLQASSSGGGGGAAVQAFSDVREPDF